MENYNYFMGRFYLVSVCFINSHMELFSEPYGLFETFDDAEQFAYNKINELKNQLKELEIDDEEIELCDFDFTIKNILLDNNNKKIKIDTTSENLIIYNPFSKKWIMSHETEIIPDKTFNKWCLTCNEEHREFYLRAGAKWDDEKKHGYTYKINKKLIEYFKFR